MKAQPKILMVGNKKGGVGKTTISIHMAGLLHRYGNKVLVIDQDTQQSSEDAHRLRKAKGNEPSFDYIFWPHPLSRDQIYEKAEGYDFVIIDTPPGTAKAENSEVSIRPETLSSFTACDLLLIPTRMDRTDFTSVRQYMQVATYHFATRKKHGDTHDRRAIILPNCLNPLWSYKFEHTVMKKMVEQIDGGQNILSLASTPVLQYRVYSKMQWVGKTAADLGKSNERYLLEKTLFEDVLSKLGYEDQRPSGERAKANESYKQIIVDKVLGSEVQHVG